MSNYVKLTDFASKDSLTTGNPLKLIKGTEINDEFNAIQTAVATKADLASPALLGNPTAPTQTLGNNTTRLATTAFVQQELSATQAAVNITGGTIDSVDITGGTVSGLATDLAVADGGTGSSSLTANAVLLGNGTSALQTVAPGTSGNVLTSDGTTWQSTSLSAIGVGQTWQNVTASRAVSTTYTNSTGKPILVAISTTLSTTQQLILTVDGIEIFANSYNGTSGNVTVTGIVPNNSTYSVAPAGTVSIRTWAELR